jgi:tetraacyldisaccharide 4'-kinase
MRPPNFWRSNNGIARLLEPFGQIVGGVTTRRIARARPERVSVPVICVGNLTVGGTGKTPVATAIAERLATRGFRPAILLRGYGGREKGPLAVDPQEHTAEDVGDEALLHARRFATWVAGSRILAARAAIEDGATVLVMDDGHQHTTLAKDLSLIVVDGATGFGNGRVIPAGPLRESIGAGLARADAVIVVGDDMRGVVPKLAAHRPIIRAHLAPGPEQTALRRQRVVAFAGIGDPQKFLATLQAVGAQVVAWHPFDDHYVFGPADIQPILDEAFALDALPVTTAKDAVRLTPDQRQQVNVLSVSIAWDTPEMLDALLDRVLVKAN